MSTGTPDGVPRFGGLAAVATGLAYLAAGSTYLLLPVEQRPGSTLDALLTSMARDPAGLVAQYWALALVGVFGLGAVPAVTRAIRPADDGLSRWAAALAMLGFAVAVVMFVRYTHAQPIRARAYVEGDAAVRAAIEASQTAFNLDPQGWLQFGAVGLWVLVTSAQALRSGALARPLCWLGLVVTASYWAVVAGFVLPAPMLITIAAAAGGTLLGPLWWIWLGIVLLRAPRPPSATEGSSA